MQYISKIKFQLLFTNWPLISMYTCTGSFITSIAKKRKNKIHFNLYTLLFFYFISTKQKNSKMMATLKINHKPTKIHVMEKFVHLMNIVAQAVYALMSMVVSRIWLSSYINLPIYNICSRYVFIVTQLLGFCIKKMMKIYNLFLCLIDS